MAPRYIWSYVNFTLYFAIAIFSIREAASLETYMNDDEPGNNLTIAENAVEVEHIPSGRNSTKAVLQKVVQLNAVSQPNGQFEKPLPTSIEVRSDSILYSQSGQPAVINFEVTNNRDYPTLYTFEARSEGATVLYVQPQRTYISGGSSQAVRVGVSPGGSQGTGNSGLMEFSARWPSQIPFREESVIKKVYVGTGYRSSDSSKPSISYTYNGDCGRFLEPRDCEEKLWRADITIQDSDSGLLMIKSFPVGLILNKEFIVGTTEEVRGFYRADCCLTKVDITARDTNGNERTLNIDIERIWLSTGEILAITLGSILLIILIVLIVWCVIRLCRKRRSLSIYPESRH